MAEILNDRNLGESAVDINRVLSNENDVDTGFNESDLIRISEVKTFNIIQVVQFKRSKVKLEINKYTGSQIREIKQYTDY